MSNPRSVKKSRRREEKETSPSAYPGSSSAPWTDVVLSLAIFVLAFIVRLIYLFQVEAIPLFYQLAADARSYDEWAQRIAGGDWLGQGVFYQAPLYPYFLGVLQFILGHDLWSIRVVQIILGAASCVLLYWAGRSFFSRGAGIAAGFILSAYAPAIFFDVLIQKTVLDLTLISLLLFFVSKAQQKAHWSQWVAIGAVLGLLGLSRENALMWALVLPIWIWLYFVERPPQARLRWVAVFLTGLILVLLPVGLRNLKVGGEFTLTTSQLGTNFFIGNNPAADGTYAPLRPGRSDPQFERQDATELAEHALGRSLSPGEVSSYWLRRSWDYILSQPIDWLRLMARKWLIVWNVREVEDADDFYLYQKWSWVLRFLAWINNFGLLAPIAAIGFVLTWRQWRQLWLLHALVVTFAMSVALFYVFGRYRFPLVPLLALFAGAGLVEAFELYKQRVVRRGLACAAVGLLAVVIVHWPVVGWPGPSVASYSNLGNAFAKQGKIHEAIESYQQALGIQPDDAVAHYNLANLLAEQGRLEEAKRHYEESIGIHPDFAEAHNNLGDVLLRQDELKGAIQEFLTALEINPMRSEFHFNMGTALARQGHLDEAIEHFERALQIKPDFAQAHASLGRVLAAKGDLERAIAHFRQALRIQPEFAEAHEDLGLALAQQGNQGEAAQHYQEALRIMKSRIGRQKENSPR
ncbi:MAG: tetratricopeptide repeat protein [Deltaproteobacteria bacterium]|nr:tetratricopeptide repeat protein [Deltaproteobacteria bacterium]